MKNLIEKRGKAKRVRKPPAKTAPKNDEEPSKKDQRKQVLEQQKTQETATPQQPPPIIETPPETNPDEGDRRVPLIQSRINLYSIKVSI
jgi:hypothetical protein